MSQRMNPGELLKETLLSEGSKPLLAELRSRSREILDYLEEDDDERSIEAVVDLSDISTEWVAAVFEALAPLELELEAGAESVAHGEEDTHIGQAFRDVLMTTLPPPIRSVERWLSHVKNLPEEDVNVLRERADVRAAEPYPKGLLAKGVTPLTIFQALEGVRLLVARALHHDVVAEGRPIQVDVIGGKLEAGPDPIRGETVVEEIAAAADCSVDVARGLSHWLIPLAWCCPFAFDRVEVHRTRVGMELSASPRSIEDLFVRWRASNADLRGLETIIKATLETVRERAAAFA